MATESSTVEPVKRGKPSEFSSDRISKLPDPILHHILSFLSTKGAARTSVLSRLWQHLWTWVPNIDISHSEIHVKGMSFDQIVFKILLSRRAFHIRKFRLVYHSDCNMISFRTILCAAVERNVEELDLCADGLRNLKLFVLPPSLFRCKSLVDLKLTGENIIVSTDYSVHFPRLKVLHLVRVKYKDENTFNSLFSGCPALEYLFVCLRESAPDDTLHYKISSLTLRHLILRGLSSYCPPSKVTVSAPVLEYFTIDHRFSPCVFDFKNVSNFVHAEVNIYQPIYHTHKPADWGTMLEALCNVQFLKLHFQIPKVLDQHIALYDLPRFDNLVELELSGFPFFLPFFLSMIHNCPQLKHLTVLNYMAFGTPKEDKYWISPQHVPSCLSFHLTTIVYRGFHGSEDELEFTRYVLENAKVLRSMTIRYHNKTDLKKAFGPFQKIFGFEKHSKRCQLIFEEV